MTTAPPYGSATTTSEGARLREPPPPRRKRIGKTTRIGKTGQWTVSARVWTTQTLTPLEATPTPQGKRIGKTTPCTMEARNGTIVHRTTRQTTMKDLRTTLAARNWRTMDVGL
jgi:hypothetical protein